MNFKITFRSMILRFCGVEENVNKLRHHSKTMFLLDKTCPKQLICDLLYFVHYLLLAPSCCITVNYQEIRRWSFFLKIVFSNYKLILELIQKTQKTKQCKDSIYTQISIISPFKKKSSLSCYFSEYVYFLENGIAYSAVCFFTLQRYMYFLTTN